MSSWFFWDKIKVLVQPNNIECHKDLAPDVWVSPEIICMVLADEISASSMHVAAKNNDGKGYALRFPRFMGYRTDKSLYDATTADEIESMYKDQ